MCVRVKQRQSETARNQEREGAILKEKERERDRENSWEERAHKTTW